MNNVKCIRTFFEEEDTARGIQRGFNRRMKYCGEPFLYVVHVYGKADKERVARGCIQDI